MIKCLLIEQDKKALYGGIELIDVWRNSNNASLWVDISNEDPTQENDLLTSLNCHPLAIADIQRERHPPKIELFNNYIFMLYHGLTGGKKGLDFNNVHIGLFAGERILITRHATNSHAIDHFFSQQGEILLAKNTIHLAMKIFHHSCGLYLEQLFEFEEELEAVEDEFQKKGSDSLMRQITSYRSRLVKLKRAFNYHYNIGETLKALVDDDETTLITLKEVHTVNDLCERLHRLHSLSQMYYDICGDLIDGYLSITSHQLNATMRVLTVITAIFVPLSFLAGVYGMNFDYMPELKMPYGYFILLTAMLSIAVLLITLFRKKNWL